MSAFTQPGGWSTLVQTATVNGSYAVFYKVALGGESGTLSIALSEFGRRCESQFLEAEAIEVELLQDVGL